LPLSLHFLPYFFAPRRRDDAAFLYTPADAVLLLPAAAISNIFRAVTAIMLPLRYAALRHIFFIFAGDILLMLILMFSPCCFRQLLPLILISPPFEVTPVLILMPFRRHAYAIAAIATLLSPMLLPPDDFALPLRRLPAARAACDFAAADARHAAARFFRRFLFR